MRHKRKKIICLLIVMVLVSGCSDDAPIHDTRGLIFIQKLDGNIPLFAKEVDIMTLHSSGKYDETKYFILQDSKNNYYAINCKVKNGTKDENSKYRSVTYYELSLYKNVTYEDVSKERYYKDKSMSYSYKSEHDEQLYTKPRYVFSDEPEIYHYRYVEIFIIGRYEYIDG